MAWVYVVLILLFLGVLLYLASSKSLSGDDDTHDVDQFVGEFRKNLDN